MTVSWGTTGGANIASSLTIQNTNTTTYLGGYANTYTGLTTFSAGTLLP
ncbi:MAG TPA: hypothetical protein VGG02_05905 [Chthoniobacterales bacterium]